MSDVIENGAVLGAEAAYDAKLCKEDEIRIAIENEVYHLRQNYSIGDFVEAIKEAPNELLEYAFKCWKNSEHCDLGASISDMVNYDIDQQARFNVNERV